MSFLTSNLPEMGGELGGGLEGCSFCYSIVLLVGFGLGKDLASMIRLKTLHLNRIATLQQPAAPLSFSGK